MAQNNIIEVKKAVEAFKALNAEPIVAQDERDWFTYRVSFYPRGHYKGHGFFLTINIELRTDLLLQEYNALKVKIKNEMHDKDVEILVKECLLEIIPSLKDFNDIGDDYQKLASLLYEKRGRVIGDRFGL